MVAASTAASSGLQCDCSHCSSCARGTAPMFALCTHMRRDTTSRHVQHRQLQTWRTQACRSAGRAAGVASCMLAAAATNIPHLSSCVHRLSSVCRHSAFCASLGAATNARPGDCSTDIGRGAAAWACCCGGRCCCCCTCSPASAALMGRRGSAPGDLATPVPALHKQHQQSGHMFVLGY